VKWRIVERHDGTAEVWAGRSLRGTQNNVDAARYEVKRHVDQALDTVILEEIDGYATDITASITGRRRRGWRS
jgi:hypothetical protein